MVNKWGERGREGKQKGKLARERNRIPFPFPPPVVFPFIFRFFFFLLRSKWRRDAKEKKLSVHSRRRCSTPLLNHRACIMLMGIPMGRLALISVTRGNLPRCRLHLPAVQCRDRVELNRGQRFSKGNVTRLISSDRAFPSQRIHLRLFEYRGKHSLPITRPRPELASPTILLG